MQPSSFNKYTHGQYYIAGSPVSLMLAQTNDFVGLHNFVPEFWGELRATIISRRTVFVHNNVHKTVAGTCNVQHSVAAPTGETISLSIEPRSAIFNWQQRHIATIGVAAGRILMDGSIEKDAGQFSRRLVSGSLVDTSQWATPDEGALKAEKLDDYLARKHAVSLYLSGASSESIKRSTNLCAKQAYRLIRERCLEIHSDGQPYGWRGLLKYLRIQPFKRHTKIRIDEFGTGGAGAMQSVLDRFPQLRADFNARILTNISTKKLVETRRSRRRHCAWFLDELRRHGCTDQEWPFNTASLGYYSVCRYIDRILTTDPKALAAAAGGPDLVKKLKTGDGTRRPVTQFMQRVEMDAHKLDGRFCVSIPLLCGGYHEKIVHRLWVIVILEIVSRAVVGYYFSVRREVSKDDVLRAIKCALGRWRPRQISFCEDAYLPGAGLLSALGDKFAGLCWNETSVDGALAETCQHVRDVLRTAVGSDLIEPENSFSIRRSKDDRPFIESFFRNLSGKGFQRMTNTTGAKPQDRKGTKPEEVALTSRFQYEYAEELLDLLIANYNATPHRGISNKTPLAYASFLYEHAPQALRLSDPAVIESVFSLRKRCVVRGGAVTGRAPFVEFFYGRYTNEILQNRQDLVGKEIWVICHREDDCRIALASMLDGMSLGVLRAAPPWHTSPHSLSVRTAICQASSRGQFVISAGSDAIEVFLQYVESQAHNKLPVHPAYLEARKILIAAAEETVGATMLESAKARAKNVALAEKTAIKSPSGEAAASASAVKNGAVKSADKLPPRRMAAT
jgi:hypothetical protein